jgi:mono/diheme cytochrome c family protein
VSRIALLGALLLAAGALAGCRGQTSEDPPIMPERNMYDTERYNPESYSDFFPDHRTMREPVEGTIARDHYRDDPEVATGLLADKSGYVMTIPQMFIHRAGGMEKILARGQERFNIYCAPCHGQTGDGKGMVTCKRDKATDPCQSRGFPPLPSYEDPRLRQMPDGQLFATISHGVRTMPAYGAQIPIDDRWSIVAYVRALQLSQMASAAPAPTQPEPKK